MARQYPNAAEPIFWQAMVKATYADQQAPFSALGAIHEARDLLIKAIKINPNTMDVLAYVTLGTLYYMAPKWPVSFGDDGVAKQMLETALKINPDGIDANYFYGEFLLLHNKPMMLQSILKGRPLLQRTLSNSMLTINSRRKQDAHCKIVKKERPAKTKACFCLYLIRQAQTIRFIPCYIILFFVKLRIQSCNAFC